jgi:flagellar basal-body rod protein FlgG
VDKKGNQIMTRNYEPILIPLDTRHVTIDQNGSIFSGSIFGDTGVQQESLGQLKIVNFNNLQALTKEGQGFYKNSDSSVKEILVDDAKVLQGFIENSNANPIHEMTQMIETLRQLEAYQKIIQSIDEIDDQSVNSLGRVG